MIRRRAGNWFRDGTLLPALTEGIDGGFVGAPTERAFEVDTQLP